MGMIVASIRTFHSGFGKYPRVFSPMDFMPGEGPRVVSPEEFAHVLGTWAGSINRGLKGKADA